VRPGAATGDVNPPASAQPSAAPVPEYRPVQPQNRN